MRVDLQETTAHISDVQMHNRIGHLLDYVR